MRLYHSSNMIVEHPDTHHSRKYLDFGRGFYLTTIHEQAVRYAQRFKRRGLSAWLNIDELSDNLEPWNIKKFESYDKERLDFVSKCRNGEDIGNYVTWLSAESQTTESYLHLTDTLQVNFPKKKLSDC